MTTALELWDKLRQQPHSWIPSEKVWPFVLTAAERETVLAVLYGASRPESGLRQVGWITFRTKDGKTKLEKGEPVSNPEYIKVHHEWVWEPVYVREPQ